MSSLTQHVANLCIPTALTLAWSAGAPRAQRLAPAPPIAHLIGSTLTVVGSANSDYIYVGWLNGAAAASPATMRVYVSGRTSFFAAKDVTRLRILGRGGDDTIVNGVDLRSEIRGGEGSDYLVGGDDVDVIHCDGGSDYVLAGAGNDTVYGGHGQDTIYAQHGNDCVVSIGGGRDFVRGGGHWDYLWVDPQDSTDASANEASLGYLHTVASFKTLRVYRYVVGVGRSDALQTPSLEPLGQDLMDPTPADPIYGVWQVREPWERFGARGLVKENFAHYELFSPGGPTGSDVEQGDLGDCYFLGPLSAVAESRPDVIRNMVTALGDGTYAVRFYRGGRPYYLRVDADLWVKSPQLPRFARVGNGDNIWAALIEKAYVFFRFDEGVYSRIHAGSSPAFEHLVLTLGADRRASLSMPRSPSKQAIYDWERAGRSLASPVAYRLAQQANTFLEQVDAKLRSGRALYTGWCRSHPLNDQHPIRQDGYRSGAHIIPIVGVERDAFGAATTLVLRDQNRPQVLLRLSDPARISYLIGRCGVMRF